ncbi:MAG TPA: dihydroorotase, partial [Deltaproteobacteria bacterium]|nr:dihydroorotase [Deltaproteobacteria bacterium]
MWIKGARIVDPGQRLDFIGDIHIESGRIKAVEKTSISGILHGEVIDARGLWVFPGIIDMHAHLREPGYEYKEDIYTGSLAAAAGGIT